MKCVFCEQEFSPKRSTAQFCSAACRVKQARKKAAEEGDDSVEWKPDEVVPVTKPVALPKKPSKSPTVLLKEKVKQRILTKKTGEIGKSEGPSPTSGEKPPADSDVPPEFDPMKNALHPKRWTDQDRDHWKNVGEETIRNMESQARSGLSDFLSSIPDDAGPQTPEEAVDGVQKARVVSGTIYGDFRPLPTTDSTSINQQARQVITKLKPSKLDPNSAEAELARLEKSQLRTGKKPAASKGKEES